MCFLYLKKARYTFIWKKKILVLLKVKEGRKEIVQQKSGGCKHLQGIILPKRQACQGHKQTIVMIALLITNTVELPRFSAFLVHRGLVFLLRNINNSHRNVAKSALKIFFPCIFFLSIHDFFLLLIVRTHVMRDFFNKSGCCFFNVEKA